MEVGGGVSRREFVKTLGAASAVTAGGLVLAGPGFGQTPPAPVETNIADFTKVPRTPRSLPGPFPGKVVKVTDKRALVDETFDPKVIAEMFQK
ncbi:MAG TPA: twin-arginine translocation signal domain-containing protein, partial [Vicinamibacterales bacterium]|nr:twin-arginine translocation signal domain-containing protein [Vicinamibacterales bacterium]